MSNYIPENYIPFKSCVIYESKEEISKSEMPLLPELTY